ncbi:hypothetical protein, conserved [Eimeria brunetti]|uniref:Uncharacterized protein n=1 Tax=Eimeria brunetti TaxID=51314 RepID=U6LNA2_9EIME|nr:hypothetical protein, conserved [Eimeria brunetti]
MQHAEDQSVSAVAADHGASASSDTAAQPGMETATAATAAGVACEQEQHTSREERPTDAAAAAEEDPPVSPVSRGAHSPPVAEEMAAAKPSPTDVGNLDTTRGTEDAVAALPHASGESAGPAECSEECDRAEGEMDDGEHCLPSEANRTIPRLMGRQTWRPRGQRLSFGRLCKGSAAPGGCTGDSTAAKKRWEQQQQQKAKQREAREIEKQMRAVKEKIRLQRRKQREAKRQRKKENEMKSAKVQIIKDTTKIRRWNKRARRQLVKMSPEVIKQLYGVQL